MKKLNNPVMKQLPKVSNGFLFTLLLVVVMSFSATAQKKPYHGIQIPRHNFVDTVKIKIWDGAVIIPVEINGQTRNLLFDTGAEHGFWIGEQEDWMTSSGDSITLYDVQNVSKKTVIMKIPPIKMGDVVIENYPMMISSSLSDYVCDKIDGAFGYDLVVRGLSFKFDTKDSLMIVTDRKGFFSKEERRQPTLKYKWYHKSRPQIWVQFPFHRIKILFDSGAIGGGFDLREDLMQIWGDSDTALRRKMDEYTVRKDTTVFSTVGFWGRPTDTVPYRVFHCPEVEMGGITFTDVWVSTDNRTGKVGSSILEHNSLILDGYKRRLVLLPHDGKRVQHVGNEDTIGVKTLLADKSDTLGVLKVVVRKDGEAYKKGIRSGDYVESVNGVTITDYCTYLNIVSADKKAKRCVYRSPEGVRKEVEW